jgi:hypothetical protein
MFFRSLAQVGYEQKLRALFENVAEASQGGQGALAIAQR